MVYQESHGAWREASTARIRAPIPTKRWLSNVSYLGWCDAISALQVAQLIDASIYVGERVIHEAEDMLPAIDGDYGPIVAGGFQFDSRKSLERAWCPELTAPLHDSRKSLVL